MQAGLQQQNEESCVSVRIGAREFTLTTDVGNFAITHMHRPAPLPKLLALLTNNHIYLFPEDFRPSNVLLPVDTQLMQSCRLKTDLRSTYKLPHLLHTKLVYSGNCECFFLMLQTGDLAVFTDELYMLDTVKISGCEGSLRYCLDFEYFEKDAWRQVRKVKNGYFIVMFSDSIQLHQVQLESNHKLSKFRPGYKFTLTPINSTILEKKISHPLKIYLLNYQTKPVPIHQSSNDYLYLVCNCSDSVFFYIFDKDSMQLMDSVRLEGVGVGIVGVVSVQIGVGNMRAMLGMSNGQVKIYSLKKENRGKLLLTIDVCQNAIQNLLWNQSDQTLLSYSSDGIIAQTSLQTMVVDQKYQTGIYTSSMFLSQRTLIGVGSKGTSIYNPDQIETYPNRLLIVNELNLKYEKMFELNSAINRVTSFAETRLIELADNALLISKHQKEFNLIRTYVPPKCIAVLLVSRNIYEQNQYWLLTDRSQIYKYQILEKQVKVKEVVSLSIFRNRDDIEYKLKICYLVFSQKVVPIQFDSEVTKNDHPPTLQNHSKLQPLILGSTTGDLIIVSRNNIQLMLFRIKAFDSPIKYIIQIEPYFEPDQTKALIIFGTNQKGLMVDVCASKLPQKVHNIELREDKIVKVNNRYFSFVNGPHFNLFYFKFDITSKLQCWREDHRSPDLRGDVSLTSLVYNPIKASQFIVTGYSFGQIVVWKIHNKIEEQGYLSLIPVCMLESSKQEIIQYAYFHDDKICFNMGSLFVSKNVPNISTQLQEHVIPSNANMKVPKGKIFNEQQSISRPTRIKSTLQFKSSLDISKFSSKKHPYAIDLPDHTRKKKGRSSSSGKLTGEHAKLQSMFHFPDTQFYRSMINKRIIK